MLEIQCIIVICIYTCPVKSSELDLLTEVNGPDFICKTKPSWESLHTCYNCTPSCTCHLRRVSWIVKGSYSKNTSLFLFFLLKKTRERPSFMYPPANMGFQIALSFFVLVLVAVLRKEERWTLKCQLALTSLQTVLPSLWIHSGPGLSPFSAFSWTLSLQILFLSRGRKKKTLRYPTYRHMLSIFSSLRFEIL